MNLNDALWSYAEEFENKILENLSDGAIEPIIEEIAEIMSAELNKRDQRNVVEKLETIMSFKVSEGEIPQEAWDKVKAGLSTLLRL